MHWYSQSILLMKEISPYLGKPKDEDTAVLLESATLAWDAVSLQKRFKKKRK